MPYGIPDLRWRRLPLEDQIEIARQNGDTDYQIGAEQGGRGNRYVIPSIEEETSGGVAQPTRTTGTTGGGGTGGGGTGGGMAAPAAEEPAPVQTVPTLQIYAGGQWFRVSDPAGTEAAEKWIVMYTLPGGQQVYFEASPEQMSALFGGQAQPSTFGAISQGELDSRATTENIFFAGNVAEVESAAGENFITAYERSVAQGLGSGMVPEELRGNVEIESLIFLAEHEDWSDDRLLEQVSKTQVFVERFPEIQSFRKQGLDIADSVGAYREYENLVNQLNMQYEGRDATREEINSLIKGQKGAKAIQRTYDVFERFEENVKALSAFNEILAFRGMDPLDEDGMFNFLDGQAEDEMYEIYAESSVLEAGQAAGLGDVLSSGDVSAIVSFLGPDVPFERAFEGMNQAARLILQFRGDIDMGNLDPDDLIDLSLGVAPRSGRNQAQIAQEMERSLSSARAFLQKRTRFGTQQTAGGGRERPGLRKLRGESVE